MSDLKGRGVLITGGGSGAIGELLRQEQLEVTEADIDARIDELVTSMIGAEAPAERIAEAAARLDELRSWADGTHQE
mgnify:CR=1 FL=1